MRLDRFVVYTTLGAFIWCAILTWIGYFLGQHEGTVQEVGRQAPQYASRALFILVPALAVIAIVYVLVRRRAAARSSERA
jgi:membrane protein DedA with SNARE-associated domain